MTVPTVLRLLLPTRFWSITMQGEMFRMASTGGRASCGSRRRAYVLNVSTSWRYAPVQIVSKTSDDLPLPLNAGERDEPVLRNVDVDALEVVVRGPPDLDGGHRASSSLTGVLVQPRQSPFGTFQRGADDAHASPEAAERVAGHRARGPARRDAEVAMAFLARFFSGTPPSSSGLLPPHLLHSRGLFGSASA